MSAVDRLDALLSRFSVSTRLFHAGALCGINDFAPAAGLGQLHLVRRGTLTVEHPPHPVTQVEQPSLLFYPRPHWHRFISDPQHGADMACAHVSFVQPAQHPLARALPPVVVLPLQALGTAAAVPELLFEEAFGQRCGRMAVVNRLFEVVLVQLLRVLLEQGAVQHGLLAGLADPQLARVLVAIHGAPQEQWPLARMARIAALSRSQFAARFRAVLGQTPGEYLLGWRLGVVRDALAQGRTLEQIAPQVGYGSAAALSRAIRQGGGDARAWRQS